MNVCRNANVNIAKEPLVVAREAPGSVLGLRPDPTDSHHKRKHTTGSLNFTSVHIR